MDTLQTSVIREKQGWCARTRIELGGSRVADFRTYRVQGTEQLATSVVVSTVEGGRMTHVVGYGTLAGDFSQRVLANIVPRVTEKVVRAQHESALAQIEAIRQAIDRHYELQQRRQEQECAALTDAAVSL